MTSPSTLIRKARKAEAKGHKFAAKRLRDEAAALRRKLRKAKKPKKAKKAPTEAAMLDAAVRKLAQARLESFVTGEQRGPLDDIVDRVLGPAASNEQKIAMRRELIEARKTGENNAAAKHAMTVQMMTEANNISIVSSYMALIESHERMGNGLPPTIIVSGYMAAKLYDALRKVGYTKDGLNGSGTTREAIAGRVSADRGHWEVYDAPKGLGGSQMMVRTRSAGGAGGGGGLSSNAGTGGGSARLGHGV